MEFMQYGEIDSDSNETKEKNETKTREMLYLN
jgi:hypothetical protein